MNFKIVFFAFFFICSLTNAQNISGFVYDEVTNEPLEGAFVYLDGTTFSASTTSNGSFTLNTPEKINTFLVVRYMGYETLRLENPFSYDKKIKILLRANAINLNEVVINKSTLFSRKEMLKVFRKEFLGRTRAGSSCKIMNEDAVNVYFDSNTHVLHASATEPLHVVNERLEYDIMFDLLDFQVKFNGRSLDDEKLRESFYAGTTFFKDLSVENSAKKKRDKSYLGSPMHLLRAIANKTWEQEKYEFYVKGFQVSPQDYFTVTDSADFRKVSLIEMPEEEKPTITGLRKAVKDPFKYKSNRYELRYDKGDQSFIIFRNGLVYIDRNGLFWPISELSFGGHMGGMKVGDMLPADYEYIE